MWAQCVCLFWKFKRCVIKKKNTTKKKKKDVSFEKTIMLPSILVSKSVRAKGGHVEIQRSFNKPCPHI